MLSSFALVERGRGQGRESGWGGERKRSRREEPGQWRARLSSGRGGTRGRRWLASEIGGSAEETGRDDGPIKRDKVGSFSILALLFFDN